MAFWSVEVKPREPYVHEPSSRGRLRITQATLGNYDSAGWTTLECSVGDTRPVRLCCLNSRIVMYRLDLEYEEKENVVLSVHGSSSVHLSGYYFRCHGADHGSYTENEKPSGKTTSHVYIKRENDPGHGMNAGSSKNPIICDGADDGGDDVPKRISLSSTSTSKKRKCMTPRIQVATDYKDKGIDPANEQRDHELIRDNSIVDISPGQPHDVTQEENAIHSADLENNTREDEVQHESADKDTIMHIDSTIMDGEMLIENLEWGDLKDEVASKGKKVRVKYVGKLGNGKAFDPTEGSEIHEFELGAGHVILGWERGIDGMHVGGKRRLTIPPAMGYGDRQLEEIPANSWLFYDIELLSVRN